MAGNQEVPLVGGDVTAGVVRVGSTVRRPLGEHSPTVHAMLRHLEQVGFEGAPRLLGVDDQGREILTFVRGQVAGRPWPGWVADESRALSVARLLRRLDDAMIPLGLPAGLPPPYRGEGEDELAVVGPPPTFLGHLDVTPENTVFRDGRAHAFIDFDLARPASRVDEIANLLMWWGGWLPPQDRDPVLADLDPAARARSLVDAYGLDQDLRAEVVPVAITTAGRAWHRMRSRAEHLGGGWAQLWEDGVGERIRRRERWLVAHQMVLSEAVCG